MRLAPWLSLWVANTVFSWWVVRRGGASWFEGWRSMFLVDWLFAWRWTSDQIAFYVLLCWVLHTVWFIAGLFVPQVRGFPW